MNSILIGKIVNVHGIKGEVKVYSYTDDLENLTNLKFIFFDKDLSQKIDITSCRINKNMLLVKFKNVNSVEEATALKDKELFIKKEDISDEDTFYIEDLIGLDVYENEEKIGKLTYVFNTGANDVYEVETFESGKKIYLPAIKQVIKSVDIKSGKMYVEIMEGLI